MKPISVALQGSNRENFKITSNLGQNKFGYMMNDTDLYSINYYMHYSDKGAANQLYTAQGIEDNARDEVH